MTGLEIVGGVLVLLALFGFLTSRRENATASGTADSSANTEFIAEVVRIHEIKPHGNADKLEIALFDLAKTGPATYEVVVRKGEYKAGDLAGYFSVDCVLPLDRSYFAFLKQPNSTKTHHRLRAARLRGVYSQGLLIPTAEFSGLAFGAPIAATCGVTYHSPDVDEPSGTSLSTAKKPPSQPMPVYGVASLKKSPNMFVEGEDVCVTEKIHGTNVRFGWVRRRVLGIPFGWKFVVGSHRVIKGDANPGSRHWYGDDVWTKSAHAHQLELRTREHRGRIFYGELYGFAWEKPIQDMTYDCSRGSAPAIVIFDVQYGGKWLPYDEFRSTCAEIGLPVAPLLYRGPFSMSLPVEHSIGKSTIAAHLREGCVVGAADGTKKAKYVGADYLLRKEKEAA